MCCCDPERGCVPPFPPDRHDHGQRGDTDDHQHPRHEHHQPAGDAIALDESDHDADRRQDEQQGLAILMVVGWSKSAARAVKGA